MNRRLVTCLLLLPLLAASLAAAEEAPSAERAPIEDLRHLIEIAPGRQVGQPGNDAVDRMIQQRFTDAVARHNDPASWADAQKSLDGAAEADKAFTEARDAAQVVPESASVAQAAAEGGWSAAVMQMGRQSVAFVLDVYAGMTWFLLALAVTTLAAWWVQRRRSLLIVGLLILVAGILLPVIGSRAAKTIRSGKSLTGGGPATTTEELNAQLKEAAQASWQADTAAAKALRGMWQNGRVTYPTAAFVPGEASMSIGGGPSVRIYALAPNLIDPCNLPQGKFTGPLVYVGKTSGTMSGKTQNLEGAAALVDFNSGSRWLDTVQLGASVILVLEPPERDGATFTEATQKQTNAGLSVPRYYVKRKDLVAALGEGWQKTLADQPPAITITQARPNTWQRREVAADWLFIPPAPGTDAAQQTQLVHFQAYKDGRSIAPELSPGAASAGNLVLLSRLLDGFEKQPPHRPVLISVVNEHTNALLGEQEFDYAAFADAAAVAHELDVLEKSLAQAKFYRGVYHQAPSEALTEKLRGDVRNVAGANIEVKKPLVDKLNFLRNTIRDERNHILARFDDDERRLKRGEPALISAADRDALNDRLKQIEPENDELVRVLKVFNKYGSHITFDALTQGERGRLADAFGQVAQQFDASIAAIQASRQRLTDNMALRRRLLFLHPEPDNAAITDAGRVETARYTPLPAVLAVALDLSFGFRQMGFFFLGNMREDISINEGTEKDRANLLSLYSLLLADDYAKSLGQPSLVANTIRGAAGVPWRAYLGSKFAFANDVYFQYQLPALTLTSIRDMRPRAYTPDDQPERLDADTFNAVIHFAEGYLPRLVNGPKLMEAQWPPGARQPLTVELSARMHDQFAVLLPEAPLSNALVLINGLSQKLPNNAAMFSEVQPSLMTMTDSRGIAMIRGSVWRDGSPIVATFDKDFSHIQASVDMGDWERQMGAAGTTFAAAANVNYLSTPVVAIPLRKVDLLGLTQPLTLGALGSISVIDARQDNLPRHFATFGVTTENAAPFIKNVPLAGDGAGVVMVEPDMTFKLKAGVGLVINATPESPQGEGFPSGVGVLRNLALTSAHDMWYLTQQRLDMLSRKGVRNETAERYNAEAKAAIDRADAAQKAGRNAELMTAAEEARGLAYYAYQRGRGTIEDLTKAVVIFLALVVPFCIFVTKLTSPYNDVNRNVALFAGIFIGMAVVLRFVHPAFAVAETPEVVILAFVILGLAGFVASVIIGRFNTSMTQAVEEAQRSESADAPQSRLAGVAFVVGVNNMKRRRIRTSLTTATIVLVTFTMLSVISVGQDTAPATVRISQSTPYNGLLFARPGLAPIDPVELRRLRAHFEGSGTVVARAWAQRLGQFGEYLGYELRPQQPSPGAKIDALTAKVLVGMEPAEDGLIGRVPLAAGRWLSSDTAPELLMSVEAAGLLGINRDNFRGQKFTINGRTVELVGLLDDQRLQAMHDLSDLSLLPMLSQASQGAGGAAAASPEEASGSATLDVSANVAGPGVEVARPVDVAFVSIGFARSLGEADYRTLSVKYDAPAVPAATAAHTAWEAANRLIQFQYALVSVGLSDAVTLPESNRKIEAGEYTLASSSATHVEGILKTAIPIILVATIIFNTMLGSVIERRREVAIYNAIGLNPGHVMVFFLAESLVFGLVGSVAGYLIGQTLSLVLTHFHLVRGLNLNYSSLSVVVVIFLTIGTVLLSTIYPAIMAARAAVPSGQRRWSLPQPVGDQIHVQFPFSYDGARVLGVCAYLRDYMRQNSEASTGKFLAELGPVGLVAGGAKPQAGTDAKAYVMLFDIAPAPFDLGVHQTMEVYAYFDPRVKAHILSVHLTRLSGERGNWLAVNQPFLESLRKRLLGWRSQKPATQQEYYHEGDKLFAGAAEMPVSGAAEEHA